jgi:flagellar biogenesis protein FliO
MGILAFFTLSPRGSVYLFAQQSQDAGESADATRDSPESEMYFGNSADNAITPAAPSVFVLLQVVVVLALVSGAIYGLVLFLKKHSGINTAPDQYLKVLARVSLNAKTSCAVVSIGDEAYLIGFGDETVSLITKVNDNETVSAMLLDNAKKEIASGGKRQTFSAILAKISASFAKEKNESRVNNLAAVRQRFGKL